MKVFLNQQMFIPNSGNPLNCSTIVYNKIPLFEIYLYAVQKYPLKCLQNRTLSQVCQTRTRQVGPTQVTLHQMIIRLFNKQNQFFMLCNLLLCGSKILLKMPTKQDTLPKLLNSYQTNQSDPGNLESDDNPVI